MAGELNEGAESGGGGETLDFEATADELATGILGEEATSEQQGQEEKGAEAPAQEERPEGVAGEGTEGTGTATPAAPAAAAPGQVTAPDTWTKEAQAEWAKVPPVVQAEIAKREGDIARYVNETRAPVGIAQGVAKMLEPYQQMFQAYNVSPWNHMETLLNAHARLMFGAPSERRQLAMAILQDAGIEPASLASEQGQLTEPNQEYHNLLRRMASMEQGVTGVIGQMQAQRASELDSQVVKFAEDAAHPHFYALHKDIARLLDSGVCSTLEEAYDKAVWGNPAIRLQEQERLAKERGAVQKKAQTQKLAESRRAAAVNVRGQGTGSGAAIGGRGGSWEDTLAGTLADIRSRDAK